MATTGTPPDDGADADEPTRDEAGTDGRSRGGVAGTDEVPRDSVADADETPLVRVENVSKRFDGVQALSGVTLDIFENEVMALIGDNGAGKSTLVKILAGVFPQTAGRIYIRDEEGRLAERSLDTPGDAKAAGIETVFQELELSGQHDVAHNVFMAREPTREDLLGRVLRLVDREKMERESLEALEEIGFRVDPGAPTEELSGGQRQAVAVARALISDPEIVILDEPTAEVSVEGSGKILDLIHRLQDRGRTVVFISHNLQEVFAVADRIAVLRDGELVDVLANDGTVDREHVVGLMTGAVEGSLASAEAAAVSDGAGSSGTESNGEGGGGATSDGGTATEG